MRNTSVTRKATPGMAMAAHPLQATIMARARVTVGRAAMAQALAGLQVMAAMRAMAAPRAVLQVLPAIERRERIGIIAQLYA